MQSLAEGMEALRIGTGSLANHPVSRRPASLPHKECSDLS